ncbi:2,3-dihydro-2,3-dihydroxybenzoate dehydrogenase [Streptomyces hoynatensis]|uniref:2,3-dihydro-2,3-dihydroxybenzoate dehydrogenase n=1 Tax=Streptomyces hoynatensis TaxID=1141874 RepID=A0A3A9YSN8_9ACTN|nr:2,3-dihydro-2,3-dihydroxybenzoate dehydrogenase [Streptomyces hoynatensis]RKN39003.1 2,3-dihydro-2,3-dihydroxybenzoate dehydrogenase [Streptomyces hoynatensis]
MAAHQAAQAREFEGRVALVTGAGSGIGLATARLLAERGAQVVAADRAPAAAAPGPGAGSATGSGALHAVRLDVTEGPRVRAVVAETERRFGRIDVLVNAAGILRPGTVAELADEDWADTLDVNATGVMRVSRAVAPGMAARRSGAIVTVGSDAAGLARTGMAAYAAAKAAAVAFTRCLGLELARHGVRCNIVSPGATDTPLQRRLWTSPEAAAQAVAGDPARYRGPIPLGRLADPADVAEAIAFLASDRARHVALHELRVDGGATLHR